MTNETAVEKETKDIKQLLSMTSTKKRLDELLGKESSHFASAIITIAKTPALKNCTPESILSSAIICATLKLPLNQNLGFAYIVPYKNEAQFQVGYKGFIQLAIRSGQFKKLNATMLTKSQFKSYDELTGDINYNLNDDSDSEPYCWIGYFQLVGTNNQNGLEKFCVMTKEQLLSHAKKHSKMFAGQYSSNSLWSTDFDSMARKTVIKLLLSRYAPLSLEMQTAVLYDQSVIENNNIKYVDNGKEQTSSEPRKNIDFNELEVLGE